MTTDAKPCPVCGKQPTAENNCGYEINVYCCVDADLVGDPPEYVSSSIVGRGQSIADAFADWNEQVEERAAS